MKPVDVFPGSRRLVRGIIPSSSLLLIGPTGIGKTIFCKQFIYNGLIMGNPGIYVTTDESPKEIEHSMQNFGLNVKEYIKNGLLRIVDCYSWKVRQSSSSEYVVNGHHNFVTDVSLNIESARQNLQDIHFVFDSLTVPSTTCNKKDLFEFLQLLVARIKEVNGKAIFTVAPRALDENFMNILPIAFDGILEMRGDETGTDIKRLIRIFSIKGARHTTSWTPFEITDKGIVVKREVELRCVLCSKLIDWEPLIETIDGKKHHFDSADCLNTYKKFKNIYGEYFQ
jgi:KaiC/GvpD/RAD55 family RecA-like ATPase